MKARKMAIVLPLVLVIAAVSLANAGWGPGKGQGPGWHRGQGWGAVWNDLSEDQKKQVEALRLEFIKKIEPIQVQARKLQIEVMELWTKDKPDEAALEKKREELCALKDQMRDERRSMMTKIRSLLTPEQRKKIGPFGPGKGMGMGMGMGPRCGKGPGCTGRPYAF